MKFSVMSNATAHPAPPVRKIEDQSIQNVIILTQGAWIFLKTVSTPATFRVTRISKPLNTYTNISLPDRSPNQLERNDQELSENVFYWTIYFQSSLHTVTRSDKELSADSIYSPICCLQWWCLYDPKTEITSTYNKTNNDLKQSVILTTAIFQSIWHAWFAE